MTRWLHLSDIHLFVSPGDRGFRQCLLHGHGGGALLGGASPSDVLFEQGLAGYARQNPIDFVVITGDFFNKGHWSDDDVDALAGFLSELSEACFGDDAADGAERLLYCPGNHDLNRYASTCSDKGVPRSRPLELPAQLERSAGQGFYVPSGEADALFLGASFDPFYKAMSAATGAGERPVERRQALAHVVRAPSGGVPVAFLELNTAILSGRRADESQAMREAESRLRAFREAHVKLDHERAEGEYGSYARAMRLASGKVSEDEGHMVLPSQASLDEAKGTLAGAGDDPVVVVYTHYPIDYLADSSKLELESLMRSVNARLYLCGHVHRPALSQGRAVAEHKGYGNWLVDEIAVGGTFVDDGGYNTVSVSFGAVERCPDGVGPDRYSVNVELYTLEEDLSGALRWSRGVEADLGPYARAPGPKGASVRGEGKRRSSGESDDPDARRKSDLVEVGAESPVEDVTIDAQVNVLQGISLTVPKPALLRMPDQGRGDLSKIDEGRDDFPAGEEGGGNEGR